MPNYCVVKDCNSKGGHSFPNNNKELKKKWIVAVRRVLPTSTASRGQRSRSRSRSTGFSWEPSSYSVVCHKHFKSDDFHNYGQDNLNQHGFVRQNRRLKKDAVPSIFPWTCPTTPANIAREKRKWKRDREWQKKSELQYSESEKKKRRLNSQLNDSDDTRLFDISSVVNNVYFHDTNVVSDYTTIISHDKDQTDSIYEHVPDSTNPMFLSDDQIIDLCTGNNETSDPQCYCDDLGNPLEDDVEIPTLLHKTPGTTYSSQSPPKTEPFLNPINRDIFELPFICVDRLKDDDKEIHRLTGLYSFDQFCTAFHSLGENAYHLQYTYCKTNVSHISNKEISPINCFLLMCTKLKRNYTTEDIARMFSVSTFTASDIFLTWVKFCSRQWREIDLWPSKEIIKHYFPTDFFSKFPSTRIVVDGTEIPIKKPTNPSAQRTTFSTYKNRNTVKVLVGATPGGLISFVTPAYGRSASDRQITERSTLSAQLEPGDSIMADKGFNVQDLFAPLDVHVNMPTMFKKKNRMDQKTVIKDRKISSKRVHIERVIGAAKYFKILKEPLTPSETLLSSDIIFVCFMLHNFRRNIIDKYA